VIIEHGEHQHRDLRGGAGDLLGGGDSAELGHLDVHHENIGM
jgi:hypothetical protein